MPTDDNSSDDAPRRPPRRRRHNKLPWWRKYLLAIVSVGALATGGYSYKTYKKIEAIQTEQVHMAQSVEQLRQNNLTTAIAMHASADEKVIGLLLDMIPETRQILETAEADEKRDEVEKRLVFASELLKKVKQGAGTDDLLDCDRVNTLMIKIEDQADALLIKAAESQNAAKRTRIVIALEHIKKNAGERTSLAAKGLAPHSDKGNRTKKVLEGGTGLLDALKFCESLFKTLK